MTTPRRPLPQPDMDSRPYWDAAKRRKLALPQCRQCGRIAFPPRPRCPECLSQDLAWTELGGRGVVHSFCVMHDDFIQGFQPPYLIAHVELDEQPGLRLTSNILDCPIDRVRIGMAVEVVFEDAGKDITLPQFRPAQDPQDSPGAPRGGGAGQ